VEAESQAVALRRHMRPFPARGAGARGVRDN